MWKSVLALGFIGASSSLYAQAPLSGGSVQQIDPEAPPEPQSTLGDITDVEPLYLGGFYLTEYAEDAATEWEIVSRSGRWQIIGLRDRWHDVELTEPDQIRNYTTLIPSHTSEALFSGYLETAQVEHSQGTEEMTSTLAVLDPSNPRTPLLVEQLSEQQGFLAIVPSNGMNRAMLNRYHCLNEEHQVEVLHGNTDPLREADGDCDARDDGKVNTMVMNMLEIQELPTLIQKDGRVYQGWDRVDQYLKGEHSPW